MRERLSIRLWLMPSLRYSVLGSGLAFTKGRTAIESMAPVFRANRKKAVAAMAAARAMAAYIAQPGNLRRGAGAAGVKRVVMVPVVKRPDSVSRLNLFRSARM